MDAVSYSLAMRQQRRIKKFIHDPDSNSGIVTLPKVIAPGDSITIPAGRQAIVAELDIQGSADIQGELFYIPLGASFNNAQMKTLSIINSTDPTKPVDFPVDPTVAGVPMGTYSENLNGGTAGAIPYQSDVDTTAMLAPGTAGQVLISEGNAAPVWGDVTKVPNISGGVIGAIPYQTAQDTTTMLAPGTAGTVLTSNGNAAPSWQSISSLPKNSTTFTSSGTFTVPTGVNQIMVFGGHAGAGGGGGGYANGYIGGSGGGGSAAVFGAPIMMTVTPGQQIPVTIAAGGAGGSGSNSATDGQSGGYGGTTSFGSFIFAGSNAPGSGAKSSASNTTSGNSGSGAGIIGGTGGGYVSGGSAGGGGGGVGISGSGGVFRMYSQATGGAWWPSNGVVGAGGTSDCTNGSNGGAPSGSNGGSGGAGGSSKVIVYW